MNEHMNNDEIVNYVAQVKEIKLDWLVQKAGNLIRVWELIDAGALRCEECPYRNARFVTLAK